QALHPVTRRSGCRTHGALPDRACTPGARFSRVTRAQVCRPGYASSVRNVSSPVKDAVYHAYGLSEHYNGATGEVAHLISLELGASVAKTHAAGGDRSASGPAPAGLSLVVDMRNP